MTLPSVTPFRILLPLLFVLLAYHPKLSGQVYSDNFNTITSPNWTTSGVIGISTWTVYRSGDDWGARRNTSPAQLEFANDVSAAAQAVGYVFASVPSSAFGAPYTSTLNANNGIVTWTFNMRQIQADPGGFNSGGYGVAFILAGQTATDNTTGSGYAVVLGQSGTTDPVRLVSYVTGLNGDAGLTNIIVSNTAGLTDFGNEYLSIKVTYNPCNNNQWQLFVRNDGITAFADPASGTLTSQGTASNSVNTGIPLDMMAAYWQGSTAVSPIKTAFFDNVTVSVDGPSAVLGGNPSACVGSTATILKYSNLQGNPNQYSIQWDVNAMNAGFTNVSNASFPANPFNPSDIVPILINIPSGTLVGDYHGTFTVRNNSTMCSSQGYSFFVRIKPCVPPQPLTMRWVLLQAGQVTGDCVSTSDCNEDMLCYGLEYTPNHNGFLSSYTTSFFVDCDNGVNPILFNQSCELPDNSAETPHCELVTPLVSFNSSANTGSFPVFKRVPQIIHQVCFSIPSSPITVNRDNVPNTLNASIDSVGGSSPEFIQFYTPLVIDSLTACGALPLKWLGFNAVQFGDRISKLDWTTADEFNVSHFEVERSEDNGITFHKIGVVKASDRSEPVHHYEFIDQHAFNGRNFYRIRQVDLDAKSALSQIRVVTFQLKNDFSIHVWPNPVSETLTIDVSESTDILYMNIVDISGRILWKGISEPGSSVHQVDVAAFGPGVYSLLAEGNGVRIAEKIVVIH